MRVLLVDNLVMPEEGSLARLDVHPHLGLLSLAATAEAAGHSVQIYDPKRLLKWGELTYDSTLYEHVARELVAAHPEAVGFTTLGCSFLFALNVAALLKRDEPDLPILLGGPHATMLHREILRRFNQFDVIVRHEADEIFPLVLHNLERRTFTDIPGLSWRGSGDHDLHFNEGKPIIQDLDALPLLNYDHYPVADLELDLLRIEAGRGCPFMCTFCSTASFFQRSFRLKSAGRLVGELDHLHNRYGFSEFKLDHDLFTVNRRKILEFCEAVKDRGYRWRASARVDCVDEALLTTMAEAGCANLYFGMETGSARMQEIVKKLLDLDLVKPTLATTKRLGIETTASFITGYRDELEQDQGDTLDLLGECFSPNCLTQLHMLAPEPGTPMFEQFGAELKYDGYSGPYNAFVLGPNDEHLVRNHRDIFSTYHFYPAAMARSHHIFAVDAVDIFRRAGPIILTYTLRAYEGKLSKLIFELRHWAQREGRSDRLNHAQVLAYIADRFGPRHHLTSLFRYALCENGDDRERIAAAKSGSVAFNPHQTYRVGDHVRVLMDLHDCEALLARIKDQAEGSQLLDESKTGERHLCLLSFSDGKAVAFWVDPGIEVMLSFFAQPHSCFEAAAMINALGVVSPIAPDYFAPLVEAGILVTHASANNVTVKTTSVASKIAKLRRRAALSFN
jgi:radical SAM superfamily enzyme YgiQ (UPF0313 family)